jgi:glycerol kinase
MQKIRVNLMLTEANYKKLQHCALDGGTSASAIVDKLIADYLKRTVKKGGQR